MSIKNKIIGSFLVLVLISFVSGIFVSYNVSNIKTDVEELSDTNFSGISVLLEADRDSYQSNVALNQIMKLKDSEKINKIINKGVSDNLLQVRQRFDKFKAKLEYKLSDKKAQFNDFDRYYDLTKTHTEKLILLVKDGNISEAETYYFDLYLKDYESMRDIIDFFTEETYKVVDENKAHISGLISMSQTIFLIIALVSVVAALFFTFVISKTFNTSINKFQDGLLEFFRFLNKEIPDVSQLDTSAKDEMSKMAELINENIAKTKSYIHQDEKFIGEVNKIVESVKTGNLNNKITADTNNDSLKNLKVIFNEMLDVIINKVSDDLNQIETAINEFKRLNFTYKIPNPKGQTAVGLNDLSKTVSDMLLLNKTNGVTLQDNSSNLLSNVDKLSTASTQAAASIEETAAALEEITGNMASNSQNVNKMVKFANELTQSASNGERLATQTTDSMENINTQVNAINEAITVIDQIAFQTNILSLNAAVEAATAGEAGRGFAVVAQEVRNLASRSADAAKEIKELVENATVRANEGKNIALEMIKGYTHLNESIGSTMQLIKDVEGVIKEQQSGIEQINNAVNTLDKQTQENATVASYARDIAMQTQTIAQDIVKDADNKEFDGKNSVQAKKIEPKKVDPKPVAKKVESKPTKISESNTKPTTSSKVVTSKVSNDDEWESF